MKDNLILLKGRLDHTEKRTVNMEQLVPEEYDNVMVPG